MKRALFLFFFLLGCATQGELPKPSSPPFPSRLPTIPSEVGIWIQTSLPLGGYQLMVTFDSRILRLRRIEGGKPPFQSSPFSYPEDHPYGKVRLLGYHTRPKGPTGRVLIAKLFFWGLRPGVSPLSISLWEATTPEGKPIPNAKAELSTKVIQVPSP